MFVGHIGPSRVATRLLRISARGCRPASAIGHALAGFCCWALGHSLTEMERTLNRVGVENPFRRSVLPGAKVRGAKPAKDGPAPLSLSSLFLWTKAAPFSQVCQRVVISRYHP